MFPLVDFLRYVLRHLFGPVVDGDGERVEPVVVDQGSLLECDPRKLMNECVSCLLFYGLGLNAFEVVFDHGGIYDEFMSVENGFEGIDDSFFLLR